MNEDDKNDLIGVDPLAWLSDEEKDSITTSNPTATGEVQAMAAEAEAERPLTSEQMPVNPESTYDEGNDSIITSNPPATDEVQATVAEVDRPLASEQMPVNPESTYDEKNDSIITNNPPTADEVQATVTEVDRPLATEQMPVNPEGTYTVNLNNALTIRDVSELMDELNQIGDAHDQVVFESEALERVDTAALQLLAGFYVFATDAGKQVVWNKPSEAFCHSVELLGLNEIMNIKAIAA